MSEKDRALVARTVLQQCLHARLQVKPAGEHSEAEFVQVRVKHSGQDCGCSARWHSELSFRHCVVRVIVLACSPILLMAKFSQLYLSSLSC